MVDMKLEQYPHQLASLIWKLEANCRIFTICTRSEDCRFTGPENYSLYKTCPMIVSICRRRPASGLMKTKLARENSGEVRPCACFQGIRYGRAKYLTISFLTPRQLRKHGLVARRPGYQYRFAPSQPSVNSRRSRALRSLCTWKPVLEWFQTKIPSNLLDLVDGSHFHTLCEQGADDLEQLWKRRGSVWSIFTWVKCQYESERTPHNEKKTMMCRCWFLKSSWPNLEVLHRTGWLLLSIPGLSSEVDD